MNSRLLIHIGRFIGVVLLQVLILNNVQLSGYINPYFYVLFILLLPIEIPSLALLLLGFVLGLSIDIFSHTIGMHTAASVFLAFCRPYVLKFMAPREGYDFGLTPGIRDFGLVWFASYTSILVVFHHTAYFFLEMYRITDFFDTLARVLLSAVFTIILVLLAQYISYKDKRET